MSSDTFSAHLKSELIDPFLGRALVELHPTASAVGRSHIEDCRDLHGCQKWHRLQYHCFGTRKTIGVKEVHLITNGFDRDVKMAEEISNFYCSTTPEII